LIVPAWLTIQKENETQQGKCLMKICAFLSLFALSGIASATSLLIEAESFTKPGGWEIDTQFTETMGSPYLIAHGMGDPVADATTETTIPEDGNYAVWVRTIDWSERLGRAGGAGRFTLEINGRKLGGGLGKAAPEWTRSFSAIPKARLRR
jgi:hypothetical protein